MLDEQLVSIDILPLLQREILRIKLGQLRWLVPSLPICVPKAWMRVTIVQLPSGAFSYALNGSWWLIVFLRQISEVVLPKRNRSACRLSLRNSQAHALEISIAPNVMYQEANVLRA